MLLYFIHSVRTSRSAKYTTLRAGSPLLNGLLTKNYPFLYFSCLGTAWPWLQIQVFVFSTLHTLYHQSQYLHRPPLIFWMSDIDLRKRTSHMDETKYTNVIRPQFGTVSPSIFTSCAVFWPARRASQNTNKE